MANESEPWWRPYLIPGLLSVTLAFSSWSVAQHALIATHDAEQQQNLAVIEQRLVWLERSTGSYGAIMERLAVVETNQKIVIAELARLRLVLEGGRR